MIVLASASPQRTAILQRLGVAHRVRPADVEELKTGDPHHVALENARMKALAVGAEPGQLVIGCDTIVTIDGDVLGKPADLKEAKGMLTRLQGRAQTVLGGVAVARDGAVIAEGVAATEVRFRPLDAKQVDDYVALEEWKGRAGGYAIQLRGAALVAGITGDYENVVGLPVALLAEICPQTVGLRA